MPEAWLRDRTCQTALTARPRRRDRAKPATTPAPAAQARSRPAGPGEAGTYTGPGGAAEPPTGPGEAGTGTDTGPGGQNHEHPCPNVDINGRLANREYAELHGELRCILAHPELESPAFLEKARQADAVALRNLEGDGEPGTSSVAPEPDPTLQPGPDR